MTKKTLFHFWALMLTAITLLSCNDQGDTPITTLYKSLSIEVTETKSENFTAQITVDLKHDCGKYLVGVIEEDYFTENFSSDILAAKYIKDEATAKGANFVRVDDKYIFNGTSSVNLSEAWEIKGTKTYVIMAFGVASNGDLTSLVTKSAVKATSSSLSEGDGTFTITTEDQTPTNINITVEKSSDAPFNIFCVTPLSALDFKELYNSDKEAYAQAFIEGLIEGKYDLSKADGIFLFDRSVSFDLSTNWNLEPNCEYHIFAFGVNKDGSINGDITIETSFTEPYDDGYAIAFSDITPAPYEITLSMTPEQNVGNYCLFALSKEQVENSPFGTSDYQLAVLARETIYYAGAANFGEVDNKYIFNGNSTTTLTQLRSSSEYTIVVFGVTGMGVINTEVTCIKSTTAESPIPTGSLVSIEAVSTKSRTFDVTIDKGDFTGNYYFGVYRKSDFDEHFNSDLTELANGFIEDEIYRGVDLTYVDNTWIFDESASFNSEYSWICRPDTEYVLMAFGINGDGKIVSNIVSTVATTMGVMPSENDIKISVHGITSNAATIEAIPSNNDIYFFNYMPKAQADKMTDAEIAKYMEEEKFGVMFFRYGLSQGYDTLFTTIALEPATDYYAICYGWDYAVNTELQRVPFTTLEDVAAPALPTTIEIPEAPFGEVVVSNVTYESYDLKIIPAVEGMEYVQFMTSEDNIAEFTSQEEIIAYALETMNKKGATIQKGGDIYDAWAEYVKPLAVDYTERANVIAGYSYVMVVFGIDKETLQPTTECIIKRFSTPRGAPAKKAAAQGGTLSTLAMKVK